VSTPLPAIRKAEPSDRDRLIALDSEVWDASNTPRDPRPSVFSRVHFEEGRILVAVEGGELLGYVWIGRRTPFESNAHVRVIRSIAVSKAARRVGLATRLLQAAEARMREAGARKSSLTVLSTNAGAIALYERNGYRLEGRLHGEYLLNDALVDDLHFAKLL